MTDEEFQDLKRENFNLKLRIYFLEEQTQRHTDDDGHQNATSYMQQLQKENEQLRRRLQSQSGRIDTPGTIYNFDYEDERRALREELEKCRQENATLRKSTPSDINKVHSNIQKKSATKTTNGQSTLTSASIDSADLNTASTAIEHSFLSHYPIQMDHNDCKERERKLQDQVNSLQKQVESSSHKTNEILAELDRARQQIQQYEADIRAYEQQQAKADRVLQRLQSDYETRITSAQCQQQQMADVDNYRHEFDETNYNAYVDEYRQAIYDKDQIIKQLEEAINEITIRLRTPFTMMLPSSQTPTSKYESPHCQSLIDELNSQMQVHLETVDQLRAECVELRRSESNLRKQVESLTQLINTPNRNVMHLSSSQLANSTTTNLDVIEDAQQVQDLQTVVVQITLQLQSDAENVSSLTNRVAQIVKDREEWQDKINKLQDELEKKSSHIRHLERREPEVENRIRQQYLLKIDTLHNDIKTLQDEVIDRERLLGDFRNENKELRSQLQREQEKSVQMNDQKISTEVHAKELERNIEQQRKEIEGLSLEIRKLEDQHRKEWQQLEQEKSLEREKVTELDNKLNINSRRYAELQTQYDQMRMLLDEQKDKYEQQCQIHENQLIQIKQVNELRERCDKHINEVENDRLSAELQANKREFKDMMDQYRDADNRSQELARKNDQLKSQISVYESQRLNSENAHQQSQNEIDKLKREFSDLLREKDLHVQEINEWRCKHEAVNIDLNDALRKGENAELENQALNNENIKLKSDMDSLSVQIRRQIQQEYESEYQKETSNREAEFQNIQKAHQTIQHDFDRLNVERTRLIDQLQTVENNLQHANESLATYESDIDRLRKALALSQVKNEELAHEVSESYAEQLKEFESKYRLAEKQNYQYEKTLDDLRLENTKLVQANTQLQHEYEQYRANQPSPNENTLTTLEERGREDNNQPNEKKQELINILERELVSRDNIIKELQSAKSSYVPKDLQLDLEIQIEPLEQQPETELHYKTTYSGTFPDREPSIGKLVYNIPKSDTNTNLSSETLRESLNTRDRRIDQLIKEKNLVIADYERHISELQTIVRNRECDFINIEEKLQRTEQYLKNEQHELDTLRHKRDILIADLNIALEENEACLERIQLLEKQLEMSQFRNASLEQAAHNQSMMDDLRTKLRLRDDSIQSLQNTIADSDRALKEMRQNHYAIQSDYSRAQIRYEQMENQYKTDLENRDQIISSLRSKIADKDKEINKLRQMELDNEALLNKLRAKVRDTDENSKSEYSGARAPPNVGLRLELQKKDAQIDELKRQLDRIRKEMPSSAQADSSTIQHAQRVEIQRRARSTNFDSLNREELLYELEMALQDNDGLVQQLAKKSPNITELHNQLLDIRKELARQKYVNQVLWRKLDALIDIQGSNTRAELAIELANYHDELENLKAKQHRTNDARLAILNPNSRSSSETSLNKKDSGVESVVDNIRQSLTQQEYYRQINEKDDLINQLTKELNELRKAYENEVNQYRLKSEKAHTDLIDDLNSKQDDLRQARSQIELLKSTKIQLEQAQDQNQRLLGEIKLLQNEISSKKDLVDHYEKQMSLLEKQIANTDDGTGEMTIRTSEMSELLEEMRRLRQDLERSIRKQNELQASLDENIRLAKTPREFKFSGRGVSYPDLRIVDNAATDDIQLTNIVDEKVTRVLGSSATELQGDQSKLGKMYVVGELEYHENLRKLTADIKIVLKAIEVKMKEKLRSKFTTLTTDSSVEWLEHCSNSMNQCLIRFDQIYHLIESYWKAYLPTKNNDDEHPFSDTHLANENNELRMAQSKYIQENQTLKQKYKEQTMYLDQVLAQLTKANRKKTHTDDYLALLLRPTLDVLQKARSNMEHQLKDSKNKNIVPASSVQSNSYHRSNRLD